MGKHKSSSLIRREVFSSYKWLKTELENPSSPYPKRLQIVSIIKQLNRSTRQRPQPNTQLFCHKCGANTSRLRIRIRKNRRILTCTHCGGIQRIPLHRTLNTGRKSIKEKQPRGKKNGKNTKRV